LQQTAQVYFDVTGIGAESLLGSSLAKTVGLEIVKKLLAKFDDEAFKPAADGGFVNVKDARNL